VTPVADLGELVAASAVVSVHTPLIAGVTERTVRREHLERLPAFATFLNTSRGAIVDEADLAAVLADRPDLTAVLDVTVEEPLPPEHPLQHLSNVVLTGHNAGSVGTESFRLGAHAVDRVLEWVEHGRLAQPLGFAEASRRA
jgi:phosphoglycerate dehydrogenase-like enzyme